MLSTTLHHELIATSFVVHMNTIDEIWDRVVPMVGLKMQSEFQIMMTYFFTFGSIGGASNERGVLAM